METPFPEFVQDVMELEEPIPLAGQPSGWETVRFEVEDEPLPP